MKSKYNDDIYRAEDKIVLIAILHELEELNNRFVIKPEVVVPTQTVKESPVKQVKKV